jgi:hypothetical protein
VPVLLASSRLRLLRLSPHRDVEPGTLPVRVPDRLQAHEAVDTGDESLLVPLPEVLGDSLHLRVHNRRPLDRCPETSDVELLRRRLQRPNHPGRTLDTYRDEDNAFVEDWLWEKVHRR